MNWLEQNINFSSLTQLFISHKLVITSVFIMIIFLIKYSIVKIIKIKSKNDKRTQINRANNIFTILIIITLFNIWSEEIQKFAFSIAAFIVAIVLATREFIQCFIGFIYL